MNDPVCATSFDLVTLDSTATGALARFWAAAAGLHEVEREDVDRWIVLADRGGVRRIGIQRCETLQDSRQGARRGSIHLDLACAPEVFDTELDRLIALGARVVAEPRVEPYGSIANLSDPDGNVFDLCAYS